MQLRRALKNWKQQPWKNEIHIKRALTSQHAFPALSFSVLFSKSSPYHKRNSCPLVTDGAWIGESRHDELWRKRVISGDPGPQLAFITVCHKLAWGQKDLIGWGCYDDVHMVFYTAMIGATAPIRPVVVHVCLAPHIAIQMNQFNRGQFAIIGNKELAELVISGTKAYWSYIELDPRLWKLFMQWISSHRLNYLNT